MSFKFPDAKFVIIVSYAILAPLINSFLASSSNLLRSVDLGVF